MGAWAFAKVGHTERKLFKELARALERSLGKPRPSELANTAWAFATEGHSHPLLFELLATAINKQMDEFKASDLASAAWAFATYFAGIPFGVERISKELPFASLFDNLASTVEKSVLDF